MISDSEAVVLCLASGSENHEQELNHHWENTLSPIALFLTVHPSFLRINCVTFLFGAVIELDTGSILIERCPFITSFRLVYAPGRTRFSKLGLKTGHRLVSLRHYLGLLHGDFCLRKNLLQ